MLILLSIKHIIDFISNIKAKYFEKDTLAYDEYIKDYRDYELAWEDSSEVIIFPDEFEYIPREIFNQNIEWYRSSCTAQWTWWASDTIRKYKADKTRISPFVLRDIVKTKWLWKEWVWAYLIDTIKTALSNTFIDWYYRISSILDMKKALYRWDLIVTWSNKIDWKQLHIDKYIVKKESKWSWHAFYLTWWNDIWFIAMNSYSNKYWLNWKFIIPFDLFFKVAFNSTYAITVDPEWTKYTRDELYKKYLVSKKY